MRGGERGDESGGAKQRMATSGGVLAGGVLGLTTARLCGNKNEVARVYHSASGRSHAVDSR